MSKSKSKSGTFAGLVLFPVCLLGFFILHSAFFISPAQTPGPNNGAYLAANRTAAPGVGGFDPSTVTGYALDYDVELEASSDGTEIEVLDDQGPNKFHLLSTTGPYWTNNGSVINGKASVFFDSSTMWLQTNFSSTFEQTNIWFVVMAVGSSPSSAIQFMFDCGSAGDDRNVAYLNARSFLLHAGSDTTGSGQYLDDKFYLWELHFAGANSFVLTNSVVFTSGNVGAQGLHGFTLGSRFGGDPSSYGFKGHIARAILYNGPIASGDLTSLRTYFATNYSLWTP